MSIQAISSGTSIDYTSMAQALIKKIDTNQDGSINKSEFKTSLNSASSATTSGQDSVELFSKLDTNSDGSISQTDLETILKTLSASSSSSSSSSTSSTSSTVERAERVVQQAAQVAPADPAHLCFMTSGIPTRTASFLRKRHWHTN